MVARPMPPASSQTTRRGSAIEGRDSIQAVATVATIDGKAEVKVPPGTSSGKKLRLRGKGVSDRSGRVGDHYITVQIDVPGDLDDDAKKQLVQLVGRLKRRTSALT